MDIRDRMTNDEVDQFETFCELGKFITGMDDCEFNDKFVEIHEMSDEERLNKRTEMKNELVELTDNLNEMAKEEDAPGQFRAFLMSLIPDLMWTIDILETTMNEDGSIRSAEELEANGVDLENFLNTFNGVLMKVALLKKGFEG